MFDDVWWMRAAKSRHVCHMSSLWTKNNSCLVVLSRHVYLCFTHFTLEIPEKSRSFWLQLLRSRPCGGGVLTPWLDRFTAAQRQAATEQRREKDGVFAISSSISIQQWSKIKIRWIEYGWILGWIVLRFDILMRFELENLRMELLHTYLHHSSDFMDPGNPAASAYSNWPARFSQRGANVANSAETGFNWKLGHAGTLGKLGVNGGKWVGNGCNMLEEVAPVAESGRFVSGWGASFWDKQSLGAFHGTRSSTGTVSRFIATRRV